MIIFDGWKLIALCIACAPFAMVALIYTIGFIWGCISSLFSHVKSAIKGESQEKQTP